MILLHRQINRRGRGRMLYPQMNESRTVENLSGMWKFKAEEDLVNPRVPLSNYQWIAVPGSYNAQLIDQKLNEKVGYFWYETALNISQLQLSQRLVLRFGAVTHQAEVYINGKMVTKHVGGFTPFEVKINDYVQVGANDLKVRVSNILTNETLPSAKYEDGKETYRFDFFNYAGINRAVKLYTTSSTYIENFKVPYETDLTTTTVKPSVKVNGPYDRVNLALLDQEGNLVAESDQLDATLIIKNTKLWKPGKGYLYQLKLAVYDAYDQLLDTYTQHFGVRTVNVHDNKFFINGHPFYFQGFGKHEDFFASGRGENLPLMNWDYQIMKSMGANSYRTAHYPYSEEAMQQADRDGIVIIDEVPAVGLFVGFNVNVEIPQKGQTTWNTMTSHHNHELVIRELLDRDVDHPSVVMWSVANEPAGHEPGAYEYFAPLVKLVRGLDYQKRPVTWADIVKDSYTEDRIGKLFDVLCLNRYYGWYVGHGNLEFGAQKLREDIEGWHQRYPDKPILFTEFGADTVAGLHSLEHTPYSEEYQVDLYQMYCNVFDEYRYIIGEQPWNFADFKTSNNMIRIDGNLKGIFTRDRRPKEAAKFFKHRWLNGYNTRCNK